MGRRSRGARDADSRRANFLLLHALMRSPFAEHAVPLAEAMHAADALPRRLSWTGVHHTHTYAELARNVPQDLRSRTRIVTELSAIAGSLLDQSRSWRALHSRHRSKRDSGIEKAKCCVGNALQKVDSSRKKSCVPTEKFRGSEDAGLKSRSKSMKSQRRPRLLECGIYRLLEDYALRGISADGGISIMDAADPRALYKSFDHVKRLRGHHLPVYCCLVNRSSKFIVTGADDHLIKVWNAQTGFLERTLRGHDGDITETILYAAKDLLISAANDSTVRIWDLGSGAPVAVLNPRWTRDVNAIAVSPCPKRPYLVTAGANGSVRLWNIEALTGDPVIVSIPVFRHHDPDQSQPAPGAAAAARARAANATIPTDRPRAIITTSSPMGAATSSASIAPAHSSSLPSSRYFPNIRTEVAEPQSLRNATPTTDETQFTSAPSSGLVYCTPPVSTLPRSPAPSSIAASFAGSASPTATRNSYATGQNTLGRTLSEQPESQMADTSGVIRGNSGITNGVSSSGVANSVVSASPSVEVLSATFNAGGTRFAVSGTDNAAHVYAVEPYIASAGSMEYDSLPNVRFLASLRGHVDHVYIVSFCHSGDSIATGSRDGTARIWRRTNVRLPTQKARGPISNGLGTWTSLVLDTRRAENSVPIHIQNKARSHRGSSGARTAIAGVEASTTAAARSRRPPWPGSVDAMVWSLDDKKLITSSSDARIRVWDAGCGNLLHTLEGHSNLVYVLCPHPLDRRIIMSGGYDSKCFLWDVDRGTIVKEFGPNCGNQSMQLNPLSQMQSSASHLLDGQFAPDGASFVVSDTAGAIRIFSVDPGDMLVQAPEEQFFSNDYVPILRNEYLIAVDEANRLPLHLAPRATLCDSELRPHSSEFQTFSVELASLSRGGSNKNLDCAAATRSVSTRNARGSGFSRTETLSLCPAPTTLTAPASHASCYGIVDPFIPAKELFWRAEEFRRREQFDDRKLVLRARAAARKAAKAKLEAELETDPLLTGDVNDFVVSDSDIDATDDEFSLHNGYIQSSACEQSDSESDDDLCYSDSKMRGSRPQRLCSDAQSKLRGCRMAGSSNLHSSSSESASSYASEDLSALDVRSSEDSTDSSPSSSSEWENEMSPSVHRRRRRRRRIVTSTSSEEASGSSDGTGPVSKGGCVHRDQPRCDLRRDVKKPESMKRRRAIVSGASHSTKRNCPKNKRCGEVILNPSPSKSVHTTYFNVDQNVETASAFTNQARVSSTSNVCSRGEIPPAVMRIKLKSAGQKNVISNASRDAKSSWRDFHEDISAFNTEKDRSRDVFVKLEDQNPSFTSEQKTKLGHATGETSRQIEENQGDSASLACSAVATNANVGASDILADDFESRSNGITAASARTSDFYDSTLPTVSGSVERTSNAVSGAIPDSLPRSVRNQSYFVAVRDAVGAPSSCNMANSNNTPETAVDGKCGRRGNEFGGTKGGDSRLASRVRSQYGDLREEAYEGNRRDICLDSPHITGTVHRSRKRKARSRQSFKTNRSRRSRKHNISDEDNDITRPLQMQASRGVTSEPGALLLDTNFVKGGDAQAAVSHPDLKNQLVEPNLTRRLGIKAGFPLSASNWLRAICNRFSYIPQVNDDVTYFPQGHRKAIQSSRRAGLQPLLRPCNRRSRDMPILDGSTSTSGSDRPTSFRVVSIELQYPARLEDSGGNCATKKRPKTRKRRVSDDAMIKALRVAALLTLRPHAKDAKNIGCESVAEKDVSLTYFPVDDLPEYLVLSSRVTAASKISWRPRDRFRILFLNERRTWQYYFGRVRNVKQNVKSSPWNAVEVEYENEGDPENGNIDFVSPWELESVSEHDRNHSMMAPGMARTDFSTDNGFLHVVAQNIDMARVTDPELGSQLSWFFDPVEALATVPSYCDIVPCPMDLGIVLSRLRTAFYRCFDAFVHDMALIRANALLFNAPNSDISKAASNVYARVIDIAESTRAAYTAPQHSVSGTASVHGLGGGTFASRVPHVSIGASALSGSRFSLPSGRRLSRRDVSTRQFSSQFTRPETAASAGASVAMPFDQPSIYQAAIVNAGPVAVSTAFSCGVSQREYASQQQLIYDNRYPSLQTSPVGCIVSPQHHYSTPQTPDQQACVAALMQLPRQSGPSGQIVPQFCGSSLLQASDMHQHLPPIGFCDGQYNGRKSAEHAQGGAGTHHERMQRRGSLPMRCSIPGNAADQSYQMGMLPRMNSEPDGRHPREYFPATHPRKDSSGIARGLAKLSPAKDLESKFSQSLRNCDSYANSLCRDDGKTFLDRESRSGDCFKSCFHRADSAAPRYNAQATASINDNNTTHVVQSHEVVQMISSARVADSANFAVTSSDDMHIYTNGADQGDSATGGVSGTQSCAGSNDAAGGIPVQASTSESRSVIRRPLRLQIPNPQSHFDSEPVQMHQHGVGVVSCSTGRPEFQAATNPREHSSISAVAAESTISYLGVEQNEGVTNDSVGHHFLP